MPREPWESRALPFIYEKAWRLDIQPDDRVLDVACGPGNTTRRLLAGLGSDGRVTGKP